MATFKTKLNGLTIGMLKKIISDIPDESEINVWDIGNTGFVNNCELEIINYENLKPDVNINIEAESGYY